MDSGFGDDEAYNVYDKPWRADKNAAGHIYRPSRNKDNDTYGDLDEIMKTNRFAIKLILMNLCLPDLQQMASRTYLQSMDDQHVLLYYLMT